MHALQHLYGVKFKVILRQTIHGLKYKSIHGLFRSCMTNLTCNQQDMDRVNRLGRMDRQKIAR